MKSYAHPELLVSTAWVADHLQDSEPAHRRIRRRRAAVYARPCPWRGEDRLAYRPARSARPRLRRQRSLRRALLVQRHRQRHDRRLLRRQKQLVGLLRLLGLQTLRPRKVPDHGRRPQALGARRPAWSRDPEPKYPRTNYVAKDPDPSIRAFRDEVLKHSRRRQAAGRRAVPRRVHRRNVAHARLSARRRSARRPHSRRR